MSHAPTPSLSRRHAVVRQLLRDRRLDGLVVTALPNVLYLTNFTGSSAIVVLTDDRVHFITDFRYVTALQASRGTSHECPDLELVTVDGTYDATLARLLGTMAGARIGFEAHHLSVARHDWLSGALAKGGGGPKLLATDGLVERARVTKDAYELATLRVAAKMLSAVCGEVFDEIRPGRSEVDVAMAIDWGMRKKGFERAAFDTIVAAGPNGALPHAHPGERKLTEGDLVVLDFGGVYDSYCVDLTRTVSVGPADARSKEVYHAVRRAHDLAIERVAPGASRFDIDAAARDELTRAGLGEAFGHGTGHGLGVEVHEPPRISSRRTDASGADEAVAPGMVFTIEPGAYLPGWGGVRIEDDVVVTETGVEVLTDVTTELLEL